MITDDSPKIFLIHLYSQKEEIEALTSAIELDNQKYIPSVEELTDIYDNCLSYLNHIVFMRVLHDFYCDE